MNKHKKFIKDAYKGKYGSMCQDWKDTILEHYPEFKEEELQVGDWMIDKNAEFPPERIIFFDGDAAFYRDNASYSKGFRRKDTPEEVEEHLIAEAKRRGYRDGILIKCIEGAVGTTGQFGKIRNFWYSKTMDRLNAEFGNYSYTVYSKGQWAEIINTMTKKEAEEKLGCKII